MSVRFLLEATHREAAGIAGEVSLLLTLQSITKRDVLNVVSRIDRLKRLEEKLRDEAKLPAKE